MRGLSALDCSPRVSGYCVAGGLGQLWSFGKDPLKKDHFANAPEADPMTMDQGSTCDQSIEDPAAANACPETPIPFRIREIRFAPGTTSPTDADVVASTSGCCALI